MFPLEITFNAVEDLKLIKEKDRRCAAKILAFLQELQSSSELRDYLLVEGARFETSCDAEVKKWQEQFRRGKDLWRLKIWEPTGNSLIPYRIIYGFYPASSHQPCPRFRIFAVVHRDTFNYEQTNPYTVRILKDYHQE